jgi:ligand-binding sensor protein
MPRRTVHSPKSKAPHVEESPASSGSIATEKLQTIDSEIVQEHPEDAPPGWAEVQEKLAAKAGLSLLLVDGRQPPALVASNNNSICHAFQSSMEYVGLCDPYCGDAHRRALSAGSTVAYKCHAGLQCFTMPVQIGGEQNLAAIGGRAFVSAADYRSLVDRFRAGELNDLLPSEPFNNVIFADAERLDQLSERLRKAVRNYNASTSNAPAAGVVRTAIENERVGVATDPVESQKPQPLPDLQHEVNRLRGELAHRSHLAESLQRFLERISSREPARTYDAILSHTKELLKADRISLWVFDESSNEISLKAATGFAKRDADETPKRIGEGISGRVLESGTALVVGNIEEAGLTAAPSDRLYRS